MGVVLVTVGAGVLACTYNRGPRTVTLSSLESAPVQPISGAGRHLVADSEALKSMCTPLGPRLGLLQVRTVRDWELLRAAVPNAGPRPDLSRGMLVGVACWAGTPVNGAWPIELESIQVRSGGGLLKASFEGGTYLPDGTARLETDYVTGLQAVLAVDVNGTSFYPEP
jgi:hypothetical protein